MLSNLQTIPHFLINQIVNPKSAGIYDLAGYSDKPSGSWNVLFICLNTQKLIHSPVE